MKTNRRRFLVLVLSLTVLNLKGFSQINTPAGPKVPFGTNSSYPHGMMPTNLPTSGTYGRASEVGAIYNSWKTQFIENCGSDKARVRFDQPSETVSEGIAYGMLLAAYAADQDLLNRLWAYYKQHRNANGVMHWKISGCNTVSERNGATDAELDAAMALIVASKQWPSSSIYQTDGVTLINAIKNHEVNADGTFENGDMWKPACRNPSYQAPAYARAFKLFMAENGQNQNGFWDNVAAKTENLFANNAHSSSGLSTNWCTPQGPPSSTCSGSGTSPDKFGYDACRAPWRQGVDVLWWGPAASGQVQSVINRQADFWITKGGATVVQGSNNMNHDGSGSGDHNGAYTGPIGAMALGASANAARQKFANDLYSENKRAQMGGGYFTTILQMMGLFVQSGNFWNPYDIEVGGPSNTPPSVSLTSPANRASFCQGASVTLTASASDADGSVSKVEFYNGTSLLESKTAAPYTITWTPQESGNLSVSAKAYDNQNAATTSSLVSVIVNGAPATPIVTAAQSYCVNAIVTPLQATGQNLKWYTSSTGGTSSVTAPTPSTNVAGNTNFYVSQSVNGCESPRVLITVTIAPVTAPTVSSPVNYCQGQPSSLLSANGTSLKWYTQNSGGTGATIAPIPSTTNIGNVSYFVSQTTNGCESPRSQIIVSVGAATAAPSVTSPVSYCQNASASPLTANGQNLSWYTTQTGGNAASTAITPNTATSGTTLYYVSQTIGGCESSRSPVTVTVNSIPAAPAVISPLNYKLNEQAPALSATGSNLKWYSAAIGGTGNNSAPIPATSQTGNTLYYVSQTNSNGCESNRASLEVRVINAVEVRKSSTVPVIDGTVDAIWLHATQLQVAKTLQGTISGSDNISASFKLLWDNTYLYVLGQVTDNIKMSDSGPVYEDDGVELYFNYGNDRSGTYGNSDVQYTFKWNSTMVNSNPAGRATSGINFSMTPSNTGYIFETRIPWTNLGGPGVLGQMHGFDFHVNDDDNGGGRDAKISWNAATDDAWQNTSHFGTIHLKESNHFPTGFEGEFTENKISFYPNPFSSLINIKGLNGPTGYEIKDLNGRSILSGITSGEITANNMDAGIYYLVLTTGSGKQTLKLVKTE